LKLSWRDPWWNIENDSALVDGIQKEIANEIEPQHPLWERDVIVKLKNMKYASLHLTWSGKIDAEPNSFPRFHIFDDSGNLQDYLNEYVADYT